MVRLIPLLKLHSLLFRLRFHVLCLFESELIIPSLALLHIKTAQRIGTFLKPVTLSPLHGRFGALIKRNVVLTMRSKTYALA